MFSDCHWNRGAVSHSFLSSQPIDNPLSVRCAISVCPVRTVQGVSVPLMVRFITDSTHRHKKKCLLNSLSATPRQELETETMGNDGIVYSVAIVIIMVAIRWWWRRHHHQLLSSRRSLHLARVSLSSLFECFEWGPIRTGQTTKNLHHPRCIILLASSLLHHIHCIIND